MRGRGTSSFEVGVGEGKVVGVGAAVGTGVVVGLGIGVGSKAGTGACAVGGLTLIQPTNAKAISRTQTRVRNRLFQFRCGAINFHMTYTSQMPYPKRKTK
jgi:hypothetical protein